MKIYDNATESQECIALVQWANLNPRTTGRLIHIPNEGKRTRIGGHVLKLMGLVPGCSDYFLAIPSGTYHGFFLEMKRTKKPKAKPTPNQLAFIEKMRQAGYHACVCYGANEAITAIEVYLKNPESLKKGDNEDA